MKRTAVLLFCAAVCAVASWGAEYPSCVRASLEKGIEYLLSQQDPEDGSFSDPQMPALTALPMWALHRAGREIQSAKCEKAVALAGKFVMGCQRGDGGFYVPKPGRGGSGLGNYNTCVCASALSETGLAPASVILKARKYIASGQLTGDDTLAGGFGYDRVSRRRYADLNNTVYAMDAMRRTEKAEEFRVSGADKTDINWNKALDYISSLQEKEGPDAGGFRYNNRTPQAGTSTNSTGRVKLRAYGSMTYAGILAMVHAKLDKSDPRVRSALDYASRHWTVDENPGMGLEGLFFYYDILSRALAASGVAQIPSGGEKAVDWKKELALKLVSLQREDGSWRNENNRFWEGDGVLATSFAVLALTLCE